MKKKKLHANLIDFTTPRDIAIEKESEQLFQQVLDSLLEREKRVIIMRFYDQKTLKKCGEELGISSERIRHIEAKALRKLRHATRSDKLIEAFNLESMRSYREKQKKEEIERRKEEEEKDKLKQKEKIRLYYLWDKETPEIKKEKEELIKKREEERQKQRIKDQEYYEWYTRECVKITQEYQEKKRQELLKINEESKKTHPPESPEKVALDLIEYCNKNNFNILQLASYFNAEVYRMVVRYQNNLRSELRGELED